jgi:hypothetical protein
MANPSLDFRQIAKRGLSIQDRGRREPRSNQMGEPSPKNYWFRNSGKWPFLFIYPIRWQGWLFLLALIAIALGITIFIGFSATDFQGARGVAFAVVLIAVNIYIQRKTDFGDKFAAELLPPLKSTDREPK